MASAEVSSGSTTSISSAPHDDTPLATVDRPASSLLKQASSSTAATLFVDSTSPPPPSAATEAAHSPTTARSGAGSTPPEPSYSNRFTSSSSEDDEESSGHGSPFVSARGGSSLSSSAPSATLFMPSQSPSSFGPSAPVAAALAASMGMSQVSIAGSSSAAAAAAAAAYMASPTGHLLSRSMSASKLHMKKKKANVRYKDHCDNCLTDQTPQWRKGRRGETFCQDCGRSERRHDYARLKREREKAIEKTLVDLLENSVYVPRWAHSGAAQRQRSKPEALVEGTSQQGLAKGESAESGASDASGAEPTDSHQDTNKVDADGEGRGDGSAPADENQTPTSLDRDNSVVGKRKSAEEEEDEDDDGDEEENNGESSEQQSTTDGGADTPASVVAQVGKGEPDTAVSPAAKRRRLPNQSAGQPSPIRLARRRTSPGAQPPSTPTGLENNGTPPPSHDNDGGEPRHDNAVADKDQGSTHGEGTDEASSTIMVTETSEAAPAVDDAIVEE